MLSANFEKIFEVSPEGIVITQSDLKIVYANSAFCNLIGLHQLEIINQSELNFIDASYKDKLNELVQEMFETPGLTKHFEKKIVNANGKAIWVESISTVMDYQGSLLRISFIRDQTTHKKQQRELLELNDKLREYAFLTSHKLRHPIANILGLVSLFDLTGVNHEENTIILQNLSHTANLLNDIVSELNSAISRSKQIIEAEVFNSPKQVENILLIDDDRVNNYINQSLIKKLDPNIHVEILLSGQKAIQMLKDGEINPDIIFLDLTMPVLTGWDFLDLFTKIEGCKSRVFILTTSIDEADKSRAKQYAFPVEFISKPLTTEILAGIINNLQMGLL